MRTMSPTFAWFCSSCAWNLTLRRTTFLYLGCAFTTSTLTTIVLSIASETTVPWRSWRRPRSCSGFSSRTIGLRSAGFSRFGLVRCGAARAGARFLFGFGPDCAAGAALGRASACGGPPRLLLGGRRARRRRLSADRLGLGDRLLGSSQAPPRARLLGRPRRLGLLGRRLLRRRPRRRPLRLRPRSRRPSRSRSSFFSVRLLACLRSPLVLRARSFWIVRMRAISRLAVRSRALDSSAPVAAWKRSLKSSCAALAELRVELLVAQRSAAPSFQRDQPPASRTSS